MKKINWGIIGTGNIAEKFATDIQKVNSANLVAVASRSKNNANLFANKFNIEHAFGSYEELAKSDKIDAVYIATPHPFHAKNSILCLVNKKAVLCEKPFAMNESEVLSMIQSAKQNKIFLMEAMWSRFLPSFIKTKELIDAGLIGEIKLIQANFSFIAPFDLKNRIYNRTLGGGSLLDVGIYPVFLALFLLGTPKEIKSSAEFTQTDVDASIKIIFKYTNGALANLSSSIVSESNNSAEIVGTNGKITMEDRFHETKNIKLVLNDGTIKKQHFKYSEYGYTYEIEEVNTCLLNGKLESSLMSLDFSLKLIQTLDRIREIIHLNY